VIPSGDPRVIAVSDDGRWLAWGEPGRLRLIDLTLAKPGAAIRPGPPARPGQTGGSGAELALALEPPFELALSSVEPARLLVVQARGGSTVVRVFAVPELREVVETNLGVKGEAHLVARSGPLALLLGGTESLTAVDIAKLRAIPLPVRGPVQVVAPLSPEQVLVGARGKLEAWSIPERRPTHRLGLPLPRDAAAGGVVAGGRLLWVATTGAPDALSVFRLADGKQLASVAAGGPIKAVAGAPGSATVVAAIQPDGGSRELVALELETGERYSVVADPAADAVDAFAFAGDTGGSVAVLHDRGPPVVVSLSAASMAPYQSGPALALEALASPAPSVVAAVAAPGAGAVSDARTTEAPGAAPATPDPAPASGAAAAAPDAGGDLAARLSQWRAQVQAVVAAPPRRTAPDARTSAGDEPRSRSRAELYAWGQSARARTTATPPPPPQGWKITELATRFHIDMRSRSLLALLYASWLHGEGDVGLPVGVLARALGNDEDAWVEALGQGRLGELGWVRSRRGRTRLRGAIGRFLDEAAPRVAIVAPPYEATSEAGSQASAVLVPPAAPAVWVLPGTALDAAVLESGARDVAAALAAPVAVIDAAALPADRRAAALASRLLEARLHGALPIVVPSDAAPIAPRLLEGPALVAVVAPLPATWRALPVWPDAPAAPPQVPSAPAAGASGG
jgi:hypothetical protein